MPTVVGRILSVTAIPTRTELLAVVDDTIREADRLFETTNARGRAGRDLTPLGSSIAMFGEHARRGLRALRVLADHSMDDQAGPVARGIVDAAIAVAYVRQPTARRVRKKEIALTVDQKLALFWSYKAIAEHYSKRQDDPSRAESPEFKAAINLRIGLGIMHEGKKASSYWSGVNPRAMYEELNSALEKAGRPDAMGGFRRIFEALSFYVHPNPNDGAYFIYEQRPDGASLLLRDNHENTPLYGPATAAALLTLGRWAEELGEDPTGTVLALNQRLHPTR
jgi:hypothetical protein